MSYNPNIPLPGDLLSKSQQDINNNFTSANNIIAVNHYPFTEPSAKKGKHKFVELVNSVAIPGGISGNEGTVYARPFGADPDTNLWYTPDNSGLEYQLTRVITASIAVFANNSNYQTFSTPKPSQFGGWTFLPGGLILQYGSTANTNLNTNFQMVFPVPFVSFVGSVVITAYDSVSTDKSFVIDSGSVNLTGFKFRLSSSNQPEGAYWIAIGI